MTDRERVETAFNTIFNTMLKNIHTAQPGIVKSFDSITGLASVQPALKRKFSSESEAKELPVIEDVLVLYPGNADYIIAYELKKDLPVLLIFSERALDAWINGGGIIDPRKRRMFDLSDCVAIPQLFPLPNKLLTPIESDCISIRKRDNSSYIKLGSTITLKGNVTIEGDVTLLGSINVESDITGGVVKTAGPMGVRLATHTHPDPVSGNTGSPNPGT